MRFTTNKIGKRHNKISINAIASFSQVVIVGICYFFLYKYLLKTLGSKELGLWSLIMASSSVVNLGNLGMGSSIVKYVAAGDAKGDVERILSILDSGLLIILTFVGLLALILYWVIPGILSDVVSVDMFPLALHLIPLTLITLVISACANVFIATIDGLQFIYIRNFIISVLTIFYLILVFIFVPKYGLLGVAYAQIIQGSLMLILSIMVVYFKLPGYSIFQIRLEKKIFKELFNYGIKFQIISLCNLFFDPITKFFLSKFGNLSIVGFYEMANKLINQLRSLIVSTMEVIVPAIANIYEKGFTNIKQLFLKWFPSIFFMTIILITYLIGLANYVSVIWIGREEPIFSFILSVISLGWFFNIISSLPFFINLGTGALKWNVISQMVLVLFNIVGCYLIGRFLGGLYVSLGPMIALISAASVLIFGFCRQNEITINELISKDSLIIAIIAVIGVILSKVVFQIGHRSISFLILFTLDIVFVSIALFLNPISYRLSKEVKLIFQRSISKAL